MSKINPHQILSESLRKSGRTSRMIAYAIEQVFSGEADVAVLFFPTLQIARNHQTDYFAQFGMSEFARIFFRSIGQEQNFRIYKDDPKFIQLYDHSIFEKRFMSDVVENCGDFYPSHPFLAQKHTGMKVSAEGALKAKRGDLGWFARNEMLNHLKEMSNRFYKGDIKAVDEFLQLYCLDEERKQHEHTQFEFDLEKTIPVDFDKIKNKMTKARRLQLINRGQNNCDQMAEILGTLKKYGIDEKVLNEKAES